MKKVAEPTTTYYPDSAAVFACAMSLSQACREIADSNDALNLSECYNGMDQFMREVMRVANQFEEWACRHIAFDHLDSVWPYLLEDGFGHACLSVIHPGELVDFDDKDCLRVSMQLRLPIRVDIGLPVPVDARVSNPTPGSGFSEFWIQTVRDSIEDEDISRFTMDDDPFDAEFGLPYFGLYGVGQDGLPEHIADRKTYSETVNLAEKFAPGIIFPSVPMFTKALSLT